MKMQNDWKPVISSFIRHMRKAGFLASVVNNGDDEDYTVRTDDGAVSEINATDESNVWFAREGEENPFWAFVVLGNEPYEMIADYTARESEAGRAFEAAIEAWSESWEGKPTPQKPAA